MISVGLIGFGYSGRTFHAPLIRSTQGLEMKAIVQRHGEPDAEVDTFKSIEALLAGSNVELIVIATSNPSHFPLAQAALLADRHVVIDKPFATTSIEAEKLCELARSRGRILSVFHNRRWDGDFLTLLQLLNDKSLGRVARFNSNFDRFRPTVDATAWRQRDEPGSGILFDLAPHMLDQTTAAFGEPASVRTSVRREREGAQVDDAFDIALDYAGGLHVTLAASMLACTSRPRFSLYGSEGSWVKHGLDPQEADLKRGARPPSAAWGQEPDEAHGFLTRCEAGTTTRSEITTLPGNYLAYYENIRDVIAGTAELIVTSQQALRVQQLLELCLDSHRQQRTLAFDPVTSG